MKVFLSIFVLAGLLFGALWLIAPTEWMYWNVHLDLGSVHRIESVDFGLCSFGCRHDLLALEIGPLAKHLTNQTGFGR